MAVIRTRFIVWLVKAYIRRWGKLFVTFFAFGLFIFFILLRFYPVIVHIIPFEKKTIIGLTGAYTSDFIPDIIINNVTRGLTKVTSDGKIQPDLAASWDIKDNGKTYVFHLQKNLNFTDGTRFTSNSIQYKFSDVVISKPDDYTIIFILKNPYAPFLVTVSKPVFYNGYIGIGEYTINNIELNGNFLKSVRLLSTKDKFRTIDYVFYPSAESIKVAFTLGELTKAVGLKDTEINNINLSTFPNIIINKKTDYRQLVTMFYNIEDPVLSSKKLRDGLSYAIPDVFKEGQRVYSPYPPTLRYYDITNVADRKQDLNHARLLIDSAMKEASMSAKPVIHIKTLSKYMSTALNIQRSFRAIQIQSTVEEVDNIPRIFQIYIGDFNVPKDPDQYTLWHSSQGNNISRLKNLRIDKLLEDGRETVDPEARLKIYNDFQKYLLDEAPASFLYFPYEYEISRK